jgi:hypothetical protein
VTEPDLQAVGDRIESLLGELRESTEVRVWMRIEELVRLVTELYGAGLDRVVQLAGAHPDMIDRMGADDLVGSLLILHEIHPLTLEQRVAKAIAGLEGALGKGGAGARISRLDPSREVEVTVTVAGGGCGSTADAVRQMVTDALVNAAPDAQVAVRVETDPAASSTPVRLGRKPTQLGAR